MATKLELPSRAHQSVPFDARYVGESRGHQLSRLGRRAIVLGIALVAAVWALFPLVFLLATSLKPPGEFLQIPPRVLPSALTFEHYVRAFGEGGLGPILRNSLVVAAGTTTVSVLAGASAGYALARWRLGPVVVTSMLFLFLFFRFYPRITTVIPWFLIIRDFGLLDTRVAVILGQLGFTIPFVTWLMMVFFREMPKEIEESALVDGANPWQRFRHVAMPMATPGLASAAIFTAFMSWNEFLIASSVARRDARVLSMEVAGFVTDKGIDWGPMSAAGVTIVLPMLLFALVLQRYLVRGLTLGAVKG